MCTIARTRVPRGKEEKKKRKQIRNVCMITRTCIFEAKKKYKKHAYNCLYACFGTWGAGKG